tara:strand:- start:1169 stop:1573 length:405 start_codon:yes stop_codon:yes gene_type:complete
MLTKAAQYAIRATTYLAENSSEIHKVGIKQISEALDIPSPFLAKLMQQLSKANLVSSSKGPSGGFYFSEENQKNTLWDVITSIDGKHKFKECFLGLPQCNDTNPCEFHEVYAAFRTKLLSEFNQKDFTKNGDVT